jgi:hypothetical protein
LRAVFPASDQVLSEVEDVVGECAPQSDAFDLGRSTYGDLRESSVGSEVSIDGFTGGGSFFLDLLTFIAGHTLLPPQYCRTIALLGFQLFSSVSR